MTFWHFFQFFCPKSKKKWCTRLKKSKNMLEWGTNMTTPNVPDIRVFLGWDKPAPESVAEKLEELQQKNPAQYRRATIVVPTSGSAQRLREYMAERSYAKSGKPILMPKITLAGALIPSKGEGVATETETIAAWLQILHREEDSSVEQYAPLIPRRPNTHQERWAVGVAHKLMALRKRLEQEEVPFSAIHAKLAEQEQHAQNEYDKITAQNQNAAKAWRARRTVYNTEQKRWEKLQELFRSVDTRIGKTTISQYEAEWVNAPTLPGQSKLLIFACVPEFSPQLKTVIRHLQERAGVEVQIWVHAPLEEAEHFDAYGLPLESAWCNRVIEIEDDSIHLVDHAEAMAAKAIELAGGLNTQEVELAVADPEFSPAWVTGFAEANAAWQLNLPEGRGLRSTDLGQLCHQLADACNARTYLPLWDSESGHLQHNGMSGLETYIALLHNTWLQQALCDSPQELSKLQKQVEQIRMLLLPGSEAALRNALSAIPEIDAGYRSIALLKEHQNAVHAQYAQAVSDLLDALCDNRVADTLRTLATAIETRPAHAELLPIAQKMAQEMRLCADVAATLPSPLYALELLVRRVQDKLSGPAFSKQNATVADIHGWRELAYTRGANVILGAMHDGTLPEPVPEDDFLPESLCNELNIRHEKFRVARDSYLLTSLIHSRKKSGSVHFLVARQKADGTVLTPSNLLLRCGDKLPQRACKLFAESKTATMLPAAPAYHLRRADTTTTGITPGILENINQIAPGTPLPFAHNNKRYSPSFISLFLQCPLSFWIKNVLNIDLGDTYKEGKNEPETNEYGTVMHAVLNKLVAQYHSQEALLALCPTADSDPAAAETQMLNTAKTLAAEEWQMIYQQQTKARQTQPLPLEVQLQAMERTLLSFVHQHVQDLQDGWYNVAREYPLTPTMPLPGGGKASFYMNADRIDRHANGRWRIIDYKTSSKDKKPHDVHFDVLKDGENSLYCRYMNVQGYNFGTVPFGNKLYRWNDVQLPLYAYGLRHPSDADRLALGIGDADMATTMPDLVYYNLNSKTEALQCYYLVKDGAVERMGKSKAGMDAEQLYGSAMETVRSAIGMIRAGQCLFSAESLEFKERPYSALLSGKFRTNKPRFGALSPQNDPRCMFGLPELSK